LLDIKTLEQIDSKKMYKIYDKWAEIAEKQFISDFEVLDTKKYDHIVFAGMGGSGAIGDLFSAILSKTNVHVDVIKGYSLPKTVDINSLVITTSISGNTIETLTVLENAREIGCQTIAFTDGGKMETYCQEKNIQFRKIPLQHSPRVSFTTFLYSMLRVLQPVLPINESDIIESIDEMKKLEKVICSENLSESNIALNLANWIPDIPVIYYPWGLEASAIRFKNSLQENSKIHAISEDVIEACHNGIVSWTKSNNVKPILVRGTDDYVKTKERWEILKEFFDKEGINYKEIFSISGSILTKLINLIYLFDYTSIYKAVLTGIDPTPVKAIDFVKDRL
jgi:glucose/mannose-6-phosphate isomerase